MNNDPPQWLKDGDENWGPTDMRKRKARPLPKPPLLPPVWSSADSEERIGLSSIGCTVAAVIVVALGAFLLWMKIAG
jgi:hypothetical protein